MRLVFTHAIHPVKTQHYDFKKQENGLARGRILRIRNLGQKFLFKITSFTTNFPEEQSLSLFRKYLMGSNPLRFHWNNPHRESWKEGRNPWHNHEELFIISIPIHFSSQASRPAQRTKLLSSKPQPLETAWQAKWPPWWVTNGKSRKLCFERMANTFACLITLSVILIPINLLRSTWFQVQVLIMVEGP